MNRPKPVMLIILDGWGERQAREGNAVCLARTPFLDQLRKQYPHTRLRCSGTAVGLPDGVMGNSEVGHLNIGAGRIVYQDLLRIDQAIEDGTFAENDTFKRLMAEVKSRNSALHLMGLVSDGGVHSHIAHLKKLLEMARDQGLRHVYVHAILDGRDTAPDSGIGFVSDLQAYIERLQCGAIASICGRYYAMDRDNRWDRTEKAYRLLTQAEGVVAADPVDAVAEAYRRNETDEFVKPITIKKTANAAAAYVADGDGIIFFNFRADRARQITRAFTGVDFDLFPRKLFINLCGFVCMTAYDPNFSLPVAFPPVHLAQILGEVVSREGLRQLRIAETEKYAHVTYFFNGGEEKPFPKEERYLIPSPREVPTYDLKPEMSARLVCAEVIKRLNQEAYDLIVLNFANMDMVGHTGVLEAAIKAVETVDECLKEIVTDVRQRDGVVLVTADHGNAEQMREENGRVHTAHTLNPVPLILVDENRKEATLREGILADIAPTILEIMGIGQPAPMTGKSLLA